MRNSCPREWRGETPEDSNLLTAWPGLMSGGTSWVARRVPGGDHSGVGWSRPALRGASSVDLPIPVRADDDEAVWRAHVKETLVRTGSVVVGEEKTMRRKRTIVDIMHLGEEGQGRHYVRSPMGTLYRQRRAGSSSSARKWGVLRAADKTNGLPTDDMSMGGYPDKCPRRPSFGRGPGGERHLLRDHSEQRRLRKPAPGRGTRHPPAQLLLDVTGGRNEAAMMRTTSSAMRWLLRWRLALLGELKLTPSLRMSRGLAVVGTGVAAGLCASFSGREVLIRTWWSPTGCLRGIS